MHPSQRLRVLHFVQMSAQYYGPRFQGTAVTSRLHASMIAPATCPADLTRAGTNARIKAKRERLAAQTAAFRARALARNEAFKALQAKLNWPVNRWSRLAWPKHLAEIAKRDHGFAFEF